MCCSRDLELVQEHASVSKVSAESNASSVDWLRLMMDGHCNVRTVLCMRILYQNGVM